MATVLETKVETNQGVHDPAFLRINALMVMGDLKAALALWNEALNEQFESGIQYMKENIGESHREN
jgi:hypothetical protein